MSFLSRLSGISKKETWRQLCSETGAKFVEGKFSQSDKVVVQIRRWTITLDTLAVAAPEGASAIYTRMRVPYVNKDGFRFRIYSRGLFSKLREKLLGIQSIEVGYPGFDRQFIIKGNDESEVRKLFVNPRVRQLIQSQPSIDLEVRHDTDGAGSNLPEGVDQLYFHESGVIRDVQRLKSLYELFAEILNQLCRMGSVSEDDQNPVL